MIRAEITSSYPRLSDYEGEENKKDELLNKKDKDEDYVAQGIVEIRRRKMNKDGTQNLEGAVEHPDKQDTNENQNPDEPLEPENPENPDDIENPVDEGDTDNEDNDTHIAQQAKPSNTLTYIPYEEFSQLISAKDTKVFDYYSFDINSKLLYYATYTEIVVTRDGQEVPEEGSFVITPNSVPYGACVVCHIVFYFRFYKNQEIQCG